MSISPAGSVASMLEVLRDIAGGSGASLIRRVGVRVVRGEACADDSNEMSSGFARSLDVDTGVLHVGHRGQCFFTCTQTRSDRGQLSRDPYLSKAAGPRTNGLGEERLVFSRFLLDTYLRCEIGQWGGVNSVGTLARSSASHVEDSIF